MEIISQLIKNLNNLSQNIYFIITNLEPLNIKDEVSKDLTTLISNPEINELLNDIINKTTSLNDFLSPIATESKKETYKHHYPLKETPYAKFKIDEPPIVKDNTEKLVQLSFEDIIKDNHIKPIKRREPLDYTDCCHHCGAPNEYIYSNSKKSNQFMCKCCQNTFKIHHHYHNEISHHCPHCGYKLFLHHNRENYDVLVCSHDNCKFYLANKKLKDDNQAEHLKTYTNWYKLRYTFRLFNFNYKQIKDEDNKDFNINSKIDLNQIHHSQYTLGLILSYYTNYGLSSRKTAQIMEEIHDVKISHQTIINYAEAAAKLTERINENYNYELSDTLTGDETYIKVLGKTNYVFFFSDTNRKIITSYRIFPKRDTLCAVKALYQSFKKYKKLPDNMKIVTDGNPIYNAAQVFFSMNDIKFDLYQVIGIRNKDTTSKQWRPYKQTEERLNRTYKFNYYGTNGYGSYRGANIYMNLYVTFYNFLRKHSSLKNQTPIKLNKLESIKLMPDKWNKLLELCSSY